MAVPDPQSTNQQEQPDGAKPSASRVLRFQPGFRWKDSTPTAYKDDASPWKGVTRTLLAGGPDDPLPFQLRYFEIAPGGYSTLEKHAHEHVVFVIRGRGTVRLGERVEPLGYGDVVNVQPWEVHQFANLEGEEPLGFLCIVCKDRDRPVVIEQGTVRCELPA
jgi:quercetin dioxygenase-like cupin family protein